ncbi:DUF5789 family protein [Halobacterium zhouii]|uniref:DUF5789 family protein n=1 Tax=Halobacterium zhouii TaxID=2902624 RepID=UPI001E37D838|nr:DUF5789 family protein [Halobacterium zhouii]
MADENGEEEDDAPAVELGEGSSVEGAPLARVASRLTWGLQKSEIARKEGETEIRTPDGPQTLVTLLEDVDVPYFESRQEFESEVREAIGSGPVPTNE